MKKSYLLIPLIDTLSKISTVNFTVLKSPEQLIEDGCGASHDIACYIYNYFSNYDIPCYTLFFCEEDNNGNIGGTHSIAYIEYDKYILWIENSFENYKGLHDFKSEKDLQDAILQLHTTGVIGDCEQYNSLRFYEFSFKDHIFGEDLDTYIDKIKDRFSDEPD